MSSFQLECARGARSTNRAGNARILHKTLPLAFAIACGLAIVAILRTVEPAASWHQHLLDADSALTAGDRDRARHLYSQTARLASWQSDWFGALAAACGMSRIEKSRDDYFATRAMLVRAMILAETHQSAIGLSSVSEAFASIGEHNAAAMVKSRVRSGAPHPQFLQPSPCK